MNASHYELMSTLKDQREKLAEFVQAFAPPEYATLRTMAVDRLDATQLRIQQAMLPPFRLLTHHLHETTVVNTALIERLNTALVAMPQAAYEAADGGLTP